MPSGERAAGRLDEGAGGCDALRLFRQHPAPGRLDDQPFQAV
jgi:hypothetical protein